MYDVIICGAGPAGAFAAKILAKAGYDIILIEKESIPRDKPCAGWITPKVLELLNVSPSAFTCIQPVNGAVIWAEDKDKLIPYEVKYHRPISYGIHRIEFDALITDQAKDAGAGLVDSTYVTKVIRQKDALLVNTSRNQEFKARFVIGADGTHSIVARESGLRQKWSPNELIQSVVSETDIGRNAESLTDYYGFAELFLMPKTMSYSWYFTKCNYLNIGLGLQLSKITSTHNARLLYGEFLKNLIKINHLKGIKLASLKAHTYPVYYGPYHYPTYGDRVILVGDAGGFPINFTGKGIRPALLTGKFAAKTLISTLGRGHTRLRKYFLKWNSVLRDEYIMGDILQMIIASTDYDLLKTILLEEKQFRGLFFDLFFTLKNPRQVIMRFLSYFPLLTHRYLLYRFKKFRRYLSKL